MGPGEFEALIGARIKAIHMSEEQLIFETDRGPVGYRVEADCCSTSYFHDFYGVANLLAGEPVTGFCAVDLAPGDPGYRPETWEQGVGTIVRDAEEVQVYGYRITTVHPVFGEVSAVVSFRNASNGYYGGWMSLMDHPRGGPWLHPVTEDVVGP